MSLVNNRSYNYYAYIQLFMKQTMSNVIKTNKKDRNVCNLQKNCVPLQSGKLKRRLND